MANTLYEYYQSIGQGLPSIADRATLYQTKGLGSAAEYRGTAEQNTRLLSSLSGGGTPLPQTTAAGTGQVAAAGGTTTGGSYYGTYLPQTQALYEGVYAPVQKTYEDWAKAQTDIYAKQRADTEAALPLIQQRYSNLLNELTAKDVETQAEIKGQGEAAIGEARARAGARGMYSSGVELGQEAQIGASTAKLTKSQAESTERKKQEYTVMRGEEELNIRKLLTQLASDETEAGFKVREAIAQLGPQKLESAISLASKIISDVRAGEEFAFEKQKYAASQAKAGASAAKISALKTDIANKATLNQLVAKYGDEVEPSTIYSLYNAGSPWGPAKESLSQLYGLGITGYSEGSSSAAIEKIVEGSATRSDALQKLQMYEPSMRAEGINVDDVKNAIDAKFPPPKPKTSSGGTSGNFWDSFWTELTTKPHWV